MTETPIKIRRESLMHPLKYLSGTKRLFSTRGKPRRESSGVKIEEVCPHPESYREYTFKIGKK